MQYRASFATFLFSCTKANEHREDIADEWVSQESSWVLVTCYYREYGLSPFICGPLLEDHRHQQQEEEHCFTVASTVLATGFPPLSLYEEKKTDNLTLPAHDESLCSSSM